MNVGLIISGGGGRGAYQLGALKALDLYFNKEDFKRVNASSVGFLNSYCYFTNNIDFAIDKWKNINTISKNVLTTSIIGSQLFEESVNKIVYDKILCESINFPLLDIRKRELHYYNICEETDPVKIKSFLRASITIPILNKAVKIDGYSYVDGATVETLPLYMMDNDLNLDYILCFYFDMNDKNLDDFIANSKVPVIPICFCDTTRGLNGISLSAININNMLEKGYELTKAKLDKHFAQGISNLDYIKKVIEEEKLTNTDDTKVFSTTTALRYLNIIAKKIIKK